jgi:mannitol/fructose-specific phosphotransferase system IIA component (Ntr-type)
LALRVQQESDPKKMIDFAQQLVAKLDEEEARKNLLQRRTESPERS